MNNIWLILLAIYIISPFDAHPMVLDDLIALGAFFYIMYKNSRSKQQHQHNSFFGNAGRSQERPDTASGGPLTLNDAYNMLGVNKGASLDEISRAYRDKMVKSHPDKVTHLSEELQAKAKEITLKLNEALDLIKKNRKG